MKDSDESVNAPADKFFVEISDHSLLTMNGPDGLDLLQRISTNDLRRLGVGEHVGTVLTNEKGKIIEVVTVFRTAKNALVLSGVNQGSNRLRAWVDRFIVTEDVKTEPPNENQFRILIYNVPTDEITSVVSEDKLLLARLDYIGVSCTEVIGPTNLKSSILSRLESTMVRELSAQDYEIFRIRNLIPAFPNELSEQFNPLEVGLQALVSFSKGCYVGQEVIARLETYHKASRTLRKLHLSAMPSRLPTELAMGDGSKAGILTSCASDGDELLGMGVLKQGHDAGEFTFEAHSTPNEATASIVDS